MSKPDALFAPLVEPHTTVIPRIDPAPARAAGRSGAGGRHSVDARHWDDAGTLPRRPAELGARAIPQPDGGRRRRPEPRSRIASLDGLRGIAALVVVVYHVFLTQPALAAPYLDPTAPVDSATWWATFTVLHLFWAGPEAVFVFFVLSGLVLALPVADTGRLNAWDYYPRRLVRLFLPVWAATGLAVLWAVGFPRSWPAGTSWWVSANTTDPTVAKVLADLFLLSSPGQVNHVLWSLQWEVVYCLLLPTVLVVVRGFPRLWPVKFAAVAGALVAGVLLGSLAVSSLSLFVLGTLMAVEHRRLARWAQRLDASRLAPLWWSTAGALCVVLLLAYWFVHALGLGTAQDVARALQGLGAGLVVFVAWHWPAAQRIMTRPVMQWLGSRSFSLYLVHLPIAASVVVVLGGQPPLALVLGLTLLVALPLTEIFYRLGERPSHRVARRAGRACAEHARSVPAPEVAPALAETGPLPRIGPVRSGSRARVGADELRTGGLDRRVRQGSTGDHLRLAAPRRSTDAASCRPTWPVVEPRRDPDDPAPGPGRLVVQPRRSPDVPGRGPGSLFVPPRPRGPEPGDRATSSPDRPGPRVQRNDPVAR